MGVQIVQDQTHLEGVGIVHVQDLAQTESPVNHRAPLAHEYLPPTAQRLNEQNLTAHPFPFVLMVITHGLPLFRGQGHAGFCNQLLAGFVHAQHRILRIVGFPIQLQHVLHPADKFRVGFWRNAPRLLQPGLQTVFFSTCRTLSCESFSAHFSSTSWLARSRRVQRLGPFGGSLLANATISALTCPLSLRARRERGFGSRAASNPSSTNRCRTRSTVRTPPRNASTISRSVRLRPCGLASAKSRIRAWLSLRAADFPTETNFCNWVRSSPVRVTIYLLLTTDLLILCCLADRNGARKPDLPQPVNINLTRY